MDRAKTPSAKKPANPPRRCIFCGGGPISREHVFPAWMKAFLPADFNGTHHEVALNQWPHARVLRPGPFGPGQMNRPGDHRSRKLKVVCEACNNGWMSRLQTAAKPLLIPLITGAQSGFTAADDRLIAAWASMFTMVYEYSDERLVAATPDDRRYVMEHGEAPPHWHVWIGRFSGTSHNAGTRHSAWGLSPNPEGVAGRMTCNVQTTGFAAGQAYFQTFSSWCAELSPVMIRAIDRFMAQVGLEKIWPGARMVGAARPRRSVSDKEFVEVMDAIAALVMFAPVSSEASDS